MEEDKDGNFPANETEVLECVSYAYQHIENDPEKIYRQLDFTAKLMDGGVFVRSITWPCMIFIENNDGHTIDTIRHNLP
jgi:hypothetical protein